MTKIIDILSFSPRIARVYDASTLVVFFLFNNIREYTMLNSCWIPHGNTTTDIIRIVIELSNAFVSKSSESAEIRIVFRQYRARARWSLPRCPIQILEALFFYTKIVLFFFLNILTILQWSKSLKLRVYVSPDRTEVRPH